METSDAYRSIKYPATPSRESYATCLQKTIFEKLNLPHYLPNRVSKRLLINSAVLLSFNASLADGTGYMVVRYF